jgi:processing peptidase subunit alpha
MPALQPGLSLPPPRLRIDTLSNGLTVATEETYGQVATLALFIEAGSMYESATEVGACHFLEASAFSATASLSSEELLRLTQEHGMTTGAVFNREVLMFKVDTLRGSVREALALLVDAALRPALGEEDMERARQTITFQRAEAAAQPQVLLQEQIWAAAFGGSTPLGRSEKCPAAAAAGMRAATLRAFAERNFTPPRMVLAGVGVEHGEVVAGARALLGSLPAARGGAGAAPPTPRPAGEYVGGDLRTTPDWGALPATQSAATAKQDMAHFMVAFPSVGWRDDDMFPVCVMDTLLGGGSSFSAGGPGKGMYSRLYREALNAFPWLESANAFSTQLYDRGLLGIAGSAPPHYAGEVARIACAHLMRLSEELAGGVELARAKNQLASSVIINLEARGMLAEDIGRQILNHKKRLSVEEVARRIQAVRAQDVREVVRKALRSAPSVAVVGDVEGRVPPYENFKVRWGGATVRHLEKSVVNPPPPPPFSPPHVSPPFVALL